MSKGLQDIAAESTDYSKKAFAASSAMFEKLLGARSVESAIQIQTEYAKQAYEGFVAQATKVSELYTKVASDALKPVTTAYATSRLRRNNDRSSAADAARTSSLSSMAGAFQAPAFYCVVRRTCAHPRGSARGTMARELALDVGQASVAARSAIE